MPMAPMSPSPTTEGWIAAQISGRLRSVEKKRAPCGRPFEVLRLMLLLEAVLQADRYTEDTRTETIDRAYAAGGVVLVQIVVADPGAHDIGLGLLGQRMVVADTHHFGTRIAGIATAGDGLAAAVVGFDELRANVAGRNVPLH